MRKSTIYCPGGASSQSGSAVKERYPGHPIADCGEIPAVPPLLGQNAGPYVIPIWNSHQGEVKAAEYVWDHIEQTKIKLIDIWPKRIEFWFVRRSGIATTYKKIGSVVVAKTQCSGFLAKQAAELIPCALTTVAFNEYRNGAAWDGVLVAPAQGELESGYEVVLKETANPNNFTSFVRFVPTRAFPTDKTNVKSWLTGITMPSFGPALGDAVQTVFDEMLGATTDLRDIPKLVFVLKRVAHVGLLFEGKRLYTGDLLDAEEQEQGEISVYEAAGATRKFYTDELRKLCARKFHNLQSADFILHRGVSTCLFACPPLGLYTHGYVEETVKPVVRFYISKLFQRRFEGDLKCTREQAVFFDRHKQAWERKKSEFIQFTTVSATGE